MSWVLCFSRYFSLNVGGSCRSSPQPFVWCERLASILKWLTHIRVWLLLDNEDASVGPFLLEHNRSRRSSRVGVQKKNPVVVSFDKRGRCYALHCRKEMPGVREHVFCKKEIAHDDLFDVSIGRRVYISNPGYEVEVDGLSKITTHGHGQ